MSFRRIRPLFPQANSALICARQACNTGKRSLPGLQNTLIFPRNNSLFVSSRLLQSNGFATLASTEKNLMKRDLLYPNILITIKGYDPAILDSFCQFIQSGSHIFGLEVIKKFNLPTEKLHQTLANLPDSYKKHKVKYELKKHGRMIQIKEIPVEKADIWLQFVQSNLPEGVNMHIELKKWQDFVSPPDPRIEEQRKLDILRKKGKLNEKSS
ncbi:28S ribosomal protein S10, mitochondrial-like [Actinia tenebrosa]|uniref:Small ribosomal subunit protein uS10m n=1 Tax=Actinia tenebrosa TaxID=6105 RepID=A0A6P8IG89_ACTTE|nr:28S ribosomal protein S10, mitochondrial-like [Actinia tenebrosa]